MAIQSISGRFGFALLVASTVWALASTSQAEDAGRRVVDYSRQAVDYYNKLEIDQARAILRQGIQYAKKANVKGAPRARIHIVAGIVAVGGAGKADEGESEFIQALKADPSAVLDPLLATPEIQAVFDKARSKAGVLGPKGRKGRGGETIATLTHEPAVEQLVNTPVPVYVESADDVALAKVYVYYRSAEGSDFVRAEMQRIESGWGYEIPCEVVQAPAVEYYVVAYGPSDDKVATVGSKDSPIRVMVVTRRREGNEPSLPGRSPPVQCEESCPPGVACGSDDGDLSKEGGECTDDMECVPGLRCSDNVCVPGGQGRSSTPPRFFFQAGLAWGSAYVGSGMPADSPAPNDANLAQSWVLDTESTTDDCTTISAGKPNYCVRIDKPGFVPTLALRFLAGYYFSSRVAAAITARVQPDAGFGALSHVLIGGRFIYLVTRPQEKGLYLTLHVGGSVGQIQPRPSQPSGGGRPYVIGGLGGAQAGATLGYRFIRNLGVFVTPEVNFLFPTVLIDIDLAGGLEVAF